MGSRLAAVLLASLLAACGQARLEDAADADGADDLYSQQSNVVVGSVNWTSTTVLTDAGQAGAARAVGYLSIPAAGARCTAWLVAKDLVVTNNHCISTASQAVGAKVSFNYVDGVSSYSRVWYSCSTLVKTWSDIDATVLRCAARNGVYPGDVYGTLQLASANAASSDPVYVVHQNCDYYANPSCSPTKKFSPGYVKSAYYSSIESSYDADTLGGSSGSPVIAKSGTNANKVVALHHLGIGGDSQGRGYSNVGVKVSVLKSRLATLGL